MWMITSL